MKTYLIVILFFVSNSLFSQYIEGLSATQNGTNQIKVNLKTYLPSEGHYITYTKNIEQSYITLKVCYYMGSFGGPAVVTHLSNDFYIDIPDNGNFTLNVNLYTSGFESTCDYSNLEDTAVLNFTTPIMGTVFLKTIDMEKEDQKINLFPNPTKDFLNINSNTKIDKIKIYDATGKIIFTFFDNSRKIDVSKLKNGVYFIEVLSDKKRYSEKFIVEK